MQIAEKPEDSFMMPTVIAKLVEWVTFIFIKFCYFLSYINEEFDFNKYRSHICYCSAFKIILSVIGVILKVNSYDIELIKKFMDKKF